MAAIALAVAPQAQACDPSQYYDPSHQICQPSPPAYTPPGYGWPPQNGGSNYLPPVDHGQYSNR
jgi:hypothetical protein